MQARATRPRASVSCESGERRLATMNAAANAIRRIAVPSTGSRASRVSRLPRDEPHGQSHGHAGEDQGGCGLLRGVP